MAVLGRGAEEEPRPGQATGRWQHPPGRPRRLGGRGAASSRAPSTGARGSPPLPALGRGTDTPGAGEEGMLSAGVVTINGQLLLDNIPN